MARASVVLTSYFVPVEPANVTVYRQFSASSKGFCKGIEFAYAFCAIPCFFSLFIHVFFTSFSFAVFTKELALSSNVTTMATCERKLSTFMMFFAAGASPEFVIVVNSFQWTRSRGALTESKNTARAQCILSR